ncbi:hypothetical protein E4U03_08825 [Rothia nasimurium]|uniref:Potassium channel domain-containing protein n=1 Tax=Rothia nasimurium TaxID=85336 RepID=A0A4Y9F3A2_9MICC|nr:ion channel [Rothia nasimurium]MBF0808706.1 ion transporter [Rothia nasimurium]TFU21518.1 hypothetical protein E4U03_08825 [Rothia nasimurium]
MPVRLDNDSYLQGLIAGLMLLALAWAITTQIREQDRRFFDLVALMFIAAHACAFACYVLATQEPGQFTGLTTRTDALYFTVVTMSTVGFGDIHPVGQQAKLLVIAMIIFDLIFIAALGHAMSETLRTAREHRSHQLRKNHEQ